jgi:hypothetical protein
MPMDDADVLEDDEYANEGGDFAMSFAGDAPAAAKAPAPIYEDEGGDYEAVEGATQVADEVGHYQDPAYDTPQPLDAAPPLPDEEEEEEDWSKMPNFPGNSPGGDTIDADGDVLDEQDDDRKR